MKCSNCGKEIEGNFCSSCGSQNLNNQKNMSNENYQNPKTSVTKAYIQLCLIIAAIVCFVSSVLCFINANPIAAIWLFVSAPVLGAIAKLMIDGNNS